MRTSIRTAALAAGVALALPAAAQASTKSVFMGLPPDANGKKIAKLGADVNDFFPRGIAIHVGDSIKFAPVGFHDIDFAPTGGNPLPLISPTGTKVSGANDAGGAPFWFNGQDNLYFDSGLLTPGYGKKFTFNGTKRVNSGLPLGNKLKPVTVKFTKAGTFTYYCDIHPGMKGTVSVKPKKSKVPTAKADAKVVATQTAAALKVAKGLPKTTVPAGNVDIGVAGPNGVEFYGFLPGTVNVPVGTTLNFRMTQGSREDHTATTGPGNPQTERTSYLGTLAASLQGPPPIAPAAVYPSEAPSGAAATLTPALHGNGFWSTGVLDTSNNTPLPASGSVKFGAPGTYKFYCLIHPFMVGTVNVQ